MRAASPVLLGVALAACGAPQAPAASEPAVTVLEAGVEPRRRMHYELAAGARARAEQTSKATVTAALTDTVLETRIQKTELPTERTRIVVEVREQRPAGDVKLASLIEDATLDGDGVVDPPTRRQLQRDVAKQRGAKRAWWMSTSGVVEPIEVEAGEPRLAVTELVKLTIQQQTVRFPAEPIGIGARWRVVTRPRLEGVAWERTESYRLSGATPTEARLELEVVLTARAQELLVEPTSTTTLKGATLRSTGTLVVRLREPLGEIYGETVGEVELAVTHKDLRVTSSTQIQSVFTSKPMEP